MAVVVETGAGLANANSYISVAVADAWHEERETSGWFALSAAKKEAAVIKATEFVDIAYTWAGTIKSNAQALGWPRVGAYDNEGRLIPSDEVPAQLEHAVAFASGEIGTGRLEAAAAASAAAGSIKRKKVASLEIEYFEGGAATSAAPALSAFTTTLGRMLKGLFVGGPGGPQGKVVRWS
jgi:hypothetical protein